MTKRTLYHNFISTINSSSTSPILSIYLKSWCIRSEHTPFEPRGTASQCEGVPNFFGVLFLRVSNMVEKFTFWEVPCGQGSFKSVELYGRIFQIPLAPTTLPPIEGDWNSSEWTPFLVEEQAFDKPQWTFANNITKSSNFRIGPCEWKEESHLPYPQV